MGRGMATLGAGNRWPSGPGRLGTALLGLLASASVAAASGGGGIEAAAHEIGAHMPVYYVIPFALMLLSIAILPLTAEHWWEKLRSKALVSTVLALPVAIYFVLHLPAELGVVGAEYISFIALLASLFVISGGILLTGDLKATPMVNTLFLLIGAILANFIGTTGASMLLIRPVLQTNSERRKVAHIPIFFIFLVSNIGGCLTPLGDPPLFLGFLEGVPFAWTLRLAPEWAFMVAVLCIIFYLVDRWMVRHETPAALRLDRVRIEPLKLTGGHNFLFLAGVLLAVLFVHNEWLRVAAMAAMAVASYFTTKREIHRGNQFSFYPINEVAIVFAGIFVTMIPALLILEARGAEFGIRQPWQFFWLTGVLSSFLDNAPTYLTFTRLALGVEGIIPPASKPLIALVDHESGQALLRAISLGAVFMGANTYIGNGPNFMVKSITESRGLKMPSFFGYMLWSVGILVPLFVLVTLIFIR